MGMRWLLPSFGRCDVSSFGPSTCVPRVAAAVPPPAGRPEDDNETLIGHRGLSGEHDRLDNAKDSERTHGQSA